MKTNKTKERINMNKKVISLLLVGAIGVSGLSFAHASSAKPNKIKGLNLSKNQYIITQKFGDVDGDKIKDTVYLIGEKEKKDDIYNQNVNVLIKNGKTKKVINAKLKDLGGYEGKLFIKDFTGDKVADIFVSMETGGSGATLDNRIMTVKNDAVKMIFSEDNNMGVNFNGEFTDGFKAQLKEKNLNKEITLDLSAFKDEYIEQKIYDRNGKLLGKVEPWTDPFSMLKPVDYDGDGTYELAGHQRVSGSCHANTISNIESIWKFENSKWTPMQIEYTTILTNKF